MGLKKEIRQAIVEPGDYIHPDTVNTITNRIHRLAKPLIAQAYADGFKAAAVVADACCLCNVYSDDPVNPIDGKRL